MIILCIHVNVVIYFNNSLQEKIHLIKPARSEAVLNLAKQLDIDPLSAIIHQYRRYGGDDDELVQILFDMKLTSW